MVRKTPRGLAQGTVYVTAAFTIGIKGMPCEESMPLLQSAVPKASILEYRVPFK